MRKVACREMEHITAWHGLCVGWKPGCSAAHACLEGSLPRCTSQKPAPLILEHRVCALHWHGSMPGQSAKPCAQIRGPPLASSSGQPQPAEAILNPSQPARLFIIGVQAVVWLVKGAGQAGHLASVPPAARAPRAAGGWVQA